MLLAACAPRYHQLPVMHAADLTPAGKLPVKHVMVDAGDVTDIDIAYVDSGGSGPPVLLVHGLSSYMSYWDYQIPALQKDYRVIALDLPGYGSSQRPDAPYTPPWYANVVVGFMGELGLDSAHVVAHSMGGQIALTMALEHPETVDSLVLSAPAGIETFEPGHAQWMKDFWTEDRALHTSEVQVRTAFVNAVFNKHDDHVETLIEERVRLGKSPDFGGTSVAVSRSIAGMVDHPVFDRLDAVRAPTLFVFGTDDRMIPNPIFNGGRTRTIAERGRDAVPGAQLVMIPKGGHTVHHDAPDLFNAAMLDFLGKHAESAAVSSSPGNVWGQP